MKRGKKQAEERDQKVLEEEENERRREDRGERGMVFFVLFLVIFK